MARKWNVYERNQLLKYQIPESTWGDFSEKPVEYITGWADFDDLTFKVNQNVLIPRIESVDIVNMAEKFLVDRKEIIVGDVGCGSGALGIALIKRLINKGEKIQIVLSDLSTEAVNLAAENWKRLIGDEATGTFLVSDLLDKYPTKKFDLLVANLPYIPSFRVKGLPESVVDYEPHLALDGGNEGLEIIYRFLEQAKDFLKIDGKIILEIDYAHLGADFVNRGYRQVEIISDEFGQRRFVILSI